MVMFYPWLARMRPNIGYHDQVKVELLYVYQYFLFITMYKFIAVISLLAEWKSH